MKLHIDVHLDVEREDQEFNKTLKKSNMEMNTFQAKLIEDIREMFKQRFGKYATMPEVNVKRVD
jgi:hypothetical protein